MACRAIRAKCTVVPVILFMAGKTIGWSAFVDVVDMALRAFDLRMTVFQFERRKVVIEICGCPSLRFMTGTAVGTESSLMGIIPAMAGLAIHRRSLKIGK